MIELVNVSKTFTTASGTVEALKDSNLTIRDGEIFGIIGMSGAGKSTLTRCINMLERPSDGKVLIDGKDIGSLSNAELCAERRKITMIFQSFNLLMQRNCLKNVCFPLELVGMKKAQAAKRAMELLEMVGLADKALAYPAQLSGGQQQRVAIARALATDPKVLLCDEATSALDPQTTHSILSLITDINRKLGITVIMITHQISVVEEVCTHVAVLDKGTVAESGPVNEVFSSPKTDAARRLVYPDGAEEQLLEQENGRLIRLVFNGASAAGAPLIATMAIEQKIAASILYASTKSIRGRVYGNMLLSIPGESSETDRALGYLKNIPDLIAEEVSRNV